MLPDSKKIVGANTHHVQQKYILTGIALAGLAVSGYLFIAHVANIPVVCGETGGCHTVQESIYASHFGVPTAAYGIIFYALLGILAALEKRSLLKLLTLGGLVVSAYLTWLEAFVIFAWCRWCVVSAILATAAFFVVWFMKNTSQETVAQTSQPTVP